MSTTLRVWRVAPLAGYRAIGASDPEQGGASLPKYYRLEFHNSPLYENSNPSVGWS